MKAFQMDGPVYNVLGRIADFLILSIMYVICCLPVITIGAATTALYYTAIKMVNQEGYVCSSFWKSFKMNFKQATMIWIPSIIFFGIIIIDIILLLPEVERDSGSQVFFILNTGLLFFTSFIYTLVFPLLSRFSNTVRHTLMNAFIITARFFPWALLAFTIAALPVLLIYFFPVFSVYILILWGFFGIGISAYLSAMIYENKIFNRIYNT